VREGPATAHIRSRAEQASLISLTMGKQSRRCRLQCGRVLRHAGIGAPVERDGYLFRAGVSIMLSHRLKPVVCALVVAVAIPFTASGASAQPLDPLVAGHSMFWGSLGFQGDLSGAVNSSGIGVVSGVRAEINANTWAERYDAALIFSVGGAYNLTRRSQVFGAMTWEQSEADTTEVGLIGGLPLRGKFSDYQGWSIDVGYRHFFATDYRATPFISGSLGYQRVQDITLDLSSGVFTASDIPFYDDSWVASWRFGTGILYDLNDRFGLQVTIDIKYSGVLSDQAGIGTVGFERINDVGNRWTLPILAGAYVKF
jgi:hypothetical protein